MNKTIGIGKNIEQAIENGLKELGCTQDEVTIKVISEGGLFKKAQVELVKDNAQEEQEEVEEIKEEEKKVEVKEEIKEVKEVKEEKPKKEKVTKTEKSANKAESPKKAGLLKDQLVAFLGEIAKEAKAQNITIDFINEESFYNIKVSGENLSTMIGTGGDTLNSIEILLNIIASKNKEENKRVVLDVGGYKQSKIDKLCEMADRAVQKVLESGENYKFRPMTAKERKIIHSHLQGVEGIKTYSKGEEPHRCLIIAKQD